VSNKRLREIQDPDEFYQRAALAERGEADGVGLSRLMPETDSSAGAPDAAVAEDEDLLERIIELESLLEADRARKPKFQKPKLQAAWQEELEELNGRLETP
jgi:hypothetical protein